SLPNAEEEIKVPGLPYVRLNRRSIRMRAVGNDHRINWRIQRVAEVQSNGPDRCVVAQPQPNIVGEVIEVAGSGVVRARRPCHRLLMVRIKVPARPAMRLLNA